MKFPDVEEVKDDDEETVEVSAMERGRARREEGEGVKRGSPLSVYHLKEKWLY